MAIGGSNHLYKAESALVEHAAKVVMEIRTGPVIFDEAIASAGRKAFLDHRAADRKWTPINAASMAATTASLTVAIIAIVWMAVMTPTLPLILLAFGAEISTAAGLVFYYLTSKKPERKIQLALNSHRSQDVALKLGLGADIFGKYSFKGEIGSVKVSLRPRCCSTVQYLARTGQIHPLAYCIALIKPEKRSGYASQLLKDREIKDKPVLDFLSQVAMSTRTLAA